jgi:hypothetical protein
VSAQLLAQDAILPAKVIDPATAISKNRNWPRGFNIGFAARLDWKSGLRLKE